MNLYFWLFVLLSLLITPVSAELHIRVERGVHYRARLRVAGVRVARREDQPDAEKQLQAGNVMKGMKGWDHALAFTLFRQGHLQRVFRVMTWRNVEVHARISFEDAALTALAYAFVRTVLQTVAHGRPLPVKGRVEADFRGQGTALSFRGIASARLGMLLAAAIRLWLAASAERAKRGKAEEEQYAASH